MLKPLQIEEIVSTYRSTSIICRLFWYSYSYFVKTTTSSKR